jgi:hypothetical protein
MLTINRSNCVKICSGFFSVLCLLTSTALAQEAANKRGFQPGNSRLATSRPSTRRMAT